MNSSIRQTNYYTVLQKRKLKHPWLIAKGVSPESVSYISSAVSGLLLGTIASAMTTNSLLFLTVPIIHHS